MISNRMRTPTSALIEIDVEPRQPLGRLVGQQEGGDEGEELARRRAGIDRRGSRHRSSRRRSRSRRAFPSAGWRGWRRAPSCWRPARPPRCCSSRRARISSSSVKALTMRMPCSVSCSVSRMRVPPMNWLWATVADAPDQLAQDRTTPAAATMKLNSDMIGSCKTMTATRPISEQQIAADRGDQQVEDLARRDARRWSAAR